MPVNTRFILLLAFVHSSAFAAAVPLDPRRVSDTVIEDGTPLGVSNRYHHYANARDALELGRSLRRSPQVPALGTASSATSKLVGKRDPQAPGPGPGPGPDASPAASGPPGPPPAKPGPPGPPPPPPPPPPPSPPPAPMMSGPPGPPAPPAPGPSGPPYPYPYPYSYPLPYPEREREQYHEFPPPHEYSRYPHDQYSHPPYDGYPHQDGYVRYHDFDDPRLSHDDYPHGEFGHDYPTFGRALYSWDDANGPPRDHFPPHDYGRFHHEGEEFEEPRRGQHGPHRLGGLEREGQRTEESERTTEGPEVATDGKHSNSISIPEAKSIDLASAKLPRRAEPEEPSTRPNTPNSNSNASPGISNLFSDLGSRGDSSVPEILPRLEVREQDVPLPIPNAMSVGQFQTREAKGNEINEVAVEDHRTNPVEKFVSL